MTSAALAALSRPSGASEYPARPVTVVTGYGVGSGGDQACRLLCDQLGKQLGQPFIVTPRPGAGNLLAGRVVKDAIPDGYTLFAGNPSVFSSIFLEKGIDADKELLGVGEFSRGDVFVYTSVASGLTSIKVLVNRSKEVPIRFGSINACASMIIAMVANALNIKYEIIPFRTSEQVAQALVANDIQVAFRTAGVYTELVSSKRINMIATLSKDRSSFAPEIPTLHESGVPVQFFVANGIWAPRAAPKTIVAILNAEMKRALAVPKVVEGLRHAYQYPYHSTPEVQLENLKEENQFYTKGAIMTGYARI